ncbi:MAG: F0F1 ATP synthase subunit B [Candidatus Kerfeldbacteria bacterium]|nr:F0F1 ATP synthase subunit B [Candidatus Kerfeldbacteria bacterium]
MDLLTKLGIDWRLLIAQLVNFLIVLAVLYRLLYKPLLKFLAERRQRISQSLIKADEIDKELVELQTRQQEVLTEARKQAQEIIKQGEAEAEQRRQEILTRVRTESAKVVEEARAKFTAEQAVQFQTLRQQAAKLVTQALAKLVGKLPAEQIDKSLVEEAVKEVSKRK